jgi:hypothetical protein
MKRIFLITRIGRFLAVDQSVEARLGTEVQEKAYFEVG